MQSKVQRSKPRLAGRTRARTMVAWHLGHGRPSTAPVMKMAGDGDAGTRFPLTWAGERPNSPSPIAAQSTRRWKHHAPWSCGAPDPYCSLFKIVATRKWPRRVTPAPEPLIERHEAARDIRNEAII